jgi:hypothetical protein
MVATREKKLPDNIDDANVTIGAGPEWNIIFLIALREVSKSLLKSLHLQSMTLEMYNCNWTTVYQQDE